MLQYGETRHDTRDTETGRNPATSSMRTLRALGELPEQKQLQLTPAALYMIPLLALVAGAGLMLLVLDLISRARVLGMIGLLAVASLMATGCQNTRAKAGVISDQLHHLRAISRPVALDDGTPDQQSALEVQYWISWDKVEANVAEIATPTTTAK